MGKYIHYNKTVFSSKRGRVQSKSMKDRVDHQRTFRSVRMTAQTMVTKVQLKPTYLLLTAKEVVFQQKKCSLILTL